MVTKDTIIFQIEEPELAEVSRAGVIRFDERYHKFLKKINTGNADQTVDNKLRVPHIRECIKVGLLQTPSMTEKIPIVDDIENLSDNMVQVWFDKVLQKELRDLSLQVNHILEKHAHCPYIKDSSARVQKSVQTVPSDFQNIGGTIFLKDNHQAKTVTAGLMAGSSLSGG